MVALRDAQGEGNEILRFAQDNMGRSLRRVAIKRRAPSVRFVIARSFPHRPMNAFKSSTVSRSRHSGSSPSDRAACSIFFLVSANTDAVLHAMPSNNAG